MSPLDEAQNYLLNCLSEELAESMQEVSKIRRFTAASVCPVALKTNHQKLIDELADVEAIKFMLTSIGIQMPVNVFNPSRLAQKVTRTLHYAKVSVRLGALSKEAYQIMKEGTRNAAAASD